MVQMNFLTKQKQSQTQKTNVVTQEIKGWGINQETGVDIYTLIYKK